MALSIASLVAIAVVLRVYENRAVHPMPCGVTLNAIISTLVRTENGGQKGNYKHLGTVWSHMLTS